jgi:hypothetical protein
LSKIPSLTILAFHLLKYFLLNSVARQVPLVGWLAILDNGEHPAMLHPVDLRLNDSKTIGKGIFLHPLKSFLMVRRDRFVLRKGASCGAAKLSINYLLDQGVDCGRCRRAGCWHRHDDSA